MRDFKLVVVFMYSNIYSSTSNDGAARADSEDSLVLGARTHWWQALAPRCSPASSDHWYLQTRWYPIIECTR